MEQHRKIVTDIQILMSDHVERDWHQRYLQIPWFWET